MIRAIWRFFVDSKRLMCGQPLLGFGDFDFPPFKPCVCFFKDGNFTEIVLEDTVTIWEYLPGGSGVALGYNLDNEMIAIRVYGDVTKRPVREKAVA